MRWTESQTHLFTKIYLSYKYLWDTEDEDYRSKPKRLLAYREIGSHFHKLTNILLDEREVALKLKSLRSTYNIEINKMNQNPTYRSKLKWFRDYHRCLRDHVIRSGKLSEERIPHGDDEYEIETDDFPTLTACVENDAKIQDNCNTDSEKEVFLTQGDDDDNFELVVLKKEPKYEPGSLNNQQHKCSTKRRKRGHRRSSYNSDNHHNSGSAKNCESTEDEFDIYGKYIATQLRNMGLPRALQAQLKIQSIVSEARMDSLLEAEIGIDNSE